MGVNSKEARKVLPRALHRGALKKLTLIDAAARILELAAFRGLRLEVLLGARKGSYSVRINDQYRVCFKFENGTASDVEIVDYHR